VSCQRCDKHADGKTEFHHIKFRSTPFVFCRACLLDLGFEVWSSAWNYEWAELEGQTPPVVGVGPGVALQLRVIKADEAAHAKHLATTREKLINAWETAPFDGSNGDRADQAIELLGLPEPNPHTPTAYELLGLPEPRKVTP